MLESKLRPSQPNFKNVETPLESIAKVLFTGRAEAVEKDGSDEEEDNSDVKSKTDHIPNRSRSIYKVDTFLKIESRHPRRQGN